MWNSMEEMHVLLKNRGKINPRSSQEYADRAAAVVASSSVKSAS